MVAAMPTQIDAHPSKKTVSIRDLRMVAFGLTAAIMLVMIAGAINEDSGSVSAIDNELTELSTIQHVSISVTSIAGDNTVTKAESEAGFTVVGVTDELDTAVTCNYGGVTDAVTSDASSGAFTCLFDHDGTGTYADMSGVSDGTVTVFATVSATNSGNYFITQDLSAPTMTISTGSVADNGVTSTAAIPLTFTSSESTVNFIATDITVTGCTLGSLSGSGSVYTATCTAGSSGAVTINVNADKFSDTNGNPNTAATQYDWTADLTAPTLSSVGIASNNGANTALSIDGNTITITFTATETIATPTCAIKFAGTDATNTEVVANTEANIWTCTVVSHDSDADGTVTFTLDFTDSNGNAGTQVASTTDSSTMTHDDTLPTIGTVSIASNNGANTAKSIDTNTITVTFTASEAISGATCDMEFNDVDASATESITYLSLIHI